MNWALELARQHSPKDGQANLFGVILHTDAHPHIKKLLRDEDFWLALDEASGPRWVVFSVRAAQGNWGFPSLPPGTIGLMVQVWKEPAANKELLDAFELDSTKRLPLLLVFAEDADGTVYGTTIPISADSVEMAYTELKDILTTIANALELVRDEYRREGTRAFHAVSYTIRDHKEWQTIKRGVELLRIFRSVKLPHIA